jgi:hypothetical protein
LIAFDPRQPKQKWRPPEPVPELEMTQDSLDNSRPPDIPPKFLGICAYFRTWMRTEMCPLFFPVKNCRLPSPCPL